MDKPRAQTTDARAFLAEWQKRYKITLDDISEDMLQAMEEYGGQRCEQRNCGTIGERRGGPYLSAVAVARIGA